MWKRPAVIAGFLVLAGVAAACGDPGGAVYIRNDSSRDFILGWVQARAKGDYTYTDSVLLPAGSAGSAYVGNEHDLTFLLLTPTCDIASALRASVDDNLVVTQDEWLDRATGRSRAPSCSAPLSASAHEPGDIGEH